MGPWRCLALCIAIVSSATAQIFHVVAPNTFRLDADETVAVSLDGKESTLVNVFIQDHPGKIKNITQTVLQVLPGQPEIFKVHLSPADFPPNFLNNKNSEKLVTLTVSAPKFHKAIQIPISNHAGYVFIQTDKPIYTPKQRAHMRIIPLNEDTIPSDKPFKLQIKNPHNTVVEETVFDRNHQKFQRAFVTHNFKFPIYPVLGDWSATVNYGYQYEQNTTVHFELKEYVLPTFTVELKTPDIILESDEEFPISVDAKYVYGKKVQGQVTFRLGVKGDAPTAIFFAVIGPKDLQNGHYRHFLKPKDFSHHKNIGWFPEIEGSHLVVEATVIDSASGNKVVENDAKGRFSKTPFVISFNRCLQDFKPGLVSVFEADINYAGGKPAMGIETTIKAMTKTGPLKITHPTSISDAEGKVTFELHPEMHHESLSITLETTDRRFEGNQAVGHFEQLRYQSKDNAFIALERSSTHKLKVGEMFVKTVHMEPAAMKDIYYAVVSRGKIVRMNRLPQGEFKIQRVEFMLTHEMVPNFRLVVWTHFREELLADSLNIDIENSCNPDAKVHINPVFNLKEPGSAGKIEISGTKDTLVGLLGVDEAVYALSKKDLLTKAKMFNTMSKHDLGCGPGGGVTTNEVLSRAGIFIMTNSFVPSLNAHSSCVAIKRKKRSVASDKLSSYTGLDKRCCALGMSHDTHNRNCETRTNIVVHFLRGEHQNCSKAFLECCLYAKDNGFTDMKLMEPGSHLGRMAGVNQAELDFISIDEEDFWEKGVTVRSDFRETWIFEDKTIGPDNKEEHVVSLPHSITTWVIQAVSVSPTSGMCVAEPQKIVSFKKVFLQLNLPYSVVRNEQVEIQAIVFNYGQTRLNVVVYMYGVKDLCSGANEGEKSERKRLVVEKNSAGTVTFPVIPLKEGTFDIKVVALSPDGSDVILRKLTVIPEGFPVEIDIPIKLDPSNQQKRKKRDVSTDTYSDSIDTSLNLQVTAIKLPAPQDFVPGTESCTITALGDQFGPVIETALSNPDKLLLKPRGCGEQNMMFLAPTLYTMRYLKVKGKISPDIEEKGYAFIREGYKNQLAFRKQDGSYAAYQNKPTSTWLTAFVAKVFCQANEIVHIDENVMCSAVKWLINNQQPDGSFVEGSPVYHMDMMGGVQGKTPLTAFTLISLEECQCDAQNLLISKKRALAYLEEHLGDVEKPLAVAIMAYALSLSDSVLKKVANDKLLSMANYDEDRNMMHWGEGNSAQDIEATSYALLNQILHNDMTKGNSIVNWLNSQQLQSGSFKSTQDTVVGLQALSEYSIRAQLPALNLVANISSSNDRHFNKNFSFNEGNAHVLQSVKVDKIGGMLFVNTAGHGVGMLSVKLRYNVLNAEEKVCKFDLTVNATEVKMDRKALGGRIDHPIRNIPNRLPEDLIRGVKAALKMEPDLPVLEMDPRNRGQKASLVVVPVLDHPMLDKVARSRVRRQDGHDNSKLVLKILVCARYLGNKPAEMSIIDIGIFSGFVANEEDLKELQDDPRHLIDRYEKSSKGIVFYLKTIPSSEKYCFDFHVTREYIVGNTQTSVVKVYDYYNPDEACTVFYSPGSNSPILRTLCDGGICQCAEGGCPPKNTFESIKDFQILSDSEKVDKIRELACEKYDFVWLGTLKNEVQKSNGFYNISFEIDEVVKEGIEKENMIEGETRNFLARENCQSAWMSPTERYLIMGKDGQKYKDENGEIWHRYLLDKTSVVQLWPEVRKAKDKKLQRILKNAFKKLKANGCAL